MKMDVIHELRDLLRIVPNGLWTVDRTSQTLATSKGDATLTSDDIPSAELSAMLDLLVLARSVISDALRENMVLREEIEVLKSIIFRKEMTRTMMKLEILDECQQAVKDITTATPSARNAVRQLKELLEQEKVMVRNERKKSQFVLQPRTTDDI